MTGMSNPVVFINRRVYQRARVYRGAKIVFNARASVIDCTVRNLSEAGACLVLGTWSVLPREFELSIDGDTLICCRMIWHFDNRVGVVFPDTAPGATSTCPSNRSEP